MNTSELAVMDTNVLVYATDETAEFHVSAKALRDRGVRGELPLAVSPQVLIEFFAIITDFIYSADYTLANTGTSLPHMLEFDIVTNESGRL